MGVKAFAHLSNDSFGKRGLTAFVMPLPSRRSKIQLGLRSEQQRISRLIRSYEMIDRRFTDTMEAVAASSGEQVRD